MQTGPSIGRIQIGVLSDFDLHFTFLFFVVEQDPASAEVVFFDLALGAAEEAAETSQVVTRPVESAPDFAGLFGTISGFDDIVVESQVLAVGTRVALSPGSAGSDWRSPRS